MVVSLDGNLLTGVIDTEFSEIKKVALPEWLNQNPEIDTNVWSKKPLKITYTLRATDALKWALDQLLTGHTAIVLTDTTYSISANVWVRNITATWEGNVNWAYPWRIEVEVIIIN